MNLDRSSLDRLAKMDDEELKASILSIAAACGADVSKLEKKLCDMPALKRSVSQMSQKDIDTALKYVGEKNAKIITDSVNKMRDKQ